MVKKSFIGSLTAALVVVAVPVTQAKTTVKGRPFSATILGATVRSTGQIPAPGSNSVQAATLSSSLGSGAAITTTSFAAGSSPTTFTFKGTTTFFTANGSIRSTISGGGSVTLGASVKITINGTGKITGGTGRYAKATGKYKLSGSTAPNAPVNITIKGTITP